MPGAQSLGADVHRPGRYPEEERRHPLEAAGTAPWEDTSQGISTYVHTPRYTPTDNSPYVYSWPSIFVASASMHTGSQLCKLMASQQGCAEPSKVANCSEHHGVPLLPGKRRAKSGRGRGRRCPTAGHKLTDRDGTDTSCKVALRGVHPRERTRGDGWSPWACIAHPVGQRGGRPVPETVPAVADSLREPKAATAQPTMSARVSRPAEAGWRDGSLQPGRPTGLSSGRHRPERGRGRVERDSGAGQHCGHGGIRVPSAHGRPGKELIHLDVLTSTQQDAQPLCVQFDAFARGCARPSGQFSKSNNRLCNSPDPTAFRPPSGVPGCSDCWPTGYKSGLPPPLLGLAKHTYYFLEQNKEKRYKKRLKTVEENQH
ncbi:uncharacterized protein LOC106729791 isoform X3 [Camelus ferus]|uniref:Uncharacterized protein LOC106729791 isoform X3 n=2 Tax=Camelus ferus TaxID=419612 RepID=A0A8B8SJC2_CAMFR|nr:uncharacterized protein LOC106729791 isoform X3 [Camelus ferus]